MIDIWMDDRVRGWTDGQDGLMDGWICGPTDRRTGGWMRRQTKECTEVCMDGQIDYCIIKLVVSLSIMCSLLGVSFKYVSTKYLKT